VPSERETPQGGTTVHDVIERYIASWNQTDPQLRRKLIDEVWAPDASYIDPLAEAHGRDAIDATIAAVQAQFPGFTFTLLDSVDVHHSQARFTWGLGPANAPDGAEPVVVGFDVAVAGSDGRLTTVLGFLDRVPG
jgi:SnoaL-like protein